MSPVAELLTTFRETARRFAQEVVRPMVGTEGRDGDLSKLPNVLARAEEAGIMASPDPEHPGHEYGVWGTACVTEGPAASCAVLEEIAVECAGVAACLHAAGLGALELEEPAAVRPAVAFLCADTRLEQDLPPVESSAVWAPVLAAPGTNIWVLYTGRDGAWRRLLVPGETSGLTVEPMTPRTGLTAVEIARVTYSGDEASARSLGSGRLEPMVVRHLIGLAAIAVGTARGGLTVAHEYAAQRHQGGAKIREHAAVRLLLGEATSRTAAAAAHLDAVASQEGTVLLKNAAALKLRAVENCWRATSDALQVLGGYGYMEDYRLEKRLRDLMTLRSLRPAPDELRLLLGASGWEVRT